MSVNRNKTPHSHTIAVNRFCTIWQIKSDPHHKITIAAPGIASDVPGMPTPTHAEQMVTILQARLLALAGVQETSVDGERTILRDLKAELAYWERKVAIEKGTKPRIAAIDLS